MQLRSSRTAQVRSCSCSCLFLLFLQHILFSHFCGPKNRHIGAVFAFLGHSRSKKQRKYRYFLGLGSLKPRYLRYFLLLETNITVFTMFFGTGIYAVFSMLQAELFSWPKAPKNTVNYSVFALGKHQKNSKNPPKCAQNRHLKTHLVIFALFSPPRSPKNVKTPAE